MAKERIGIFRGAFDPIHQGHLRMAAGALEHGRLDRMLIIPSAAHSGKYCAAPKEDRWKMTVAACSQDVRLIPSRLELDRADASAADTLLALKSEYPKSDLFLLLGADEVMSLRESPCLEGILALCTILICPRVSDLPPAAFREEMQNLRTLGARFSVIPAEPCSASSADIRDRLAAGLPTPALFSPVREYCSLKGLYGMPCREERAEEWIDRLFTALNPHRFSHTLSVASYARRLARIHGIDQRQAGQAGLLHDCAKCMPLKEMREIAVSHALTDDPAFLSSNALLHSLVGAWIAEHDYGMTDRAVLEAIAWHNTGHAGMSRLAMCVCLADSIEPTRESYPQLEQIRILAELSLERALLMSLESTADFVQQRGKFLHPRTKETIAWLKTLPETRNTKKENIKG